MLISKYRIPVLVVTAALATLAQSQYTTNDDARCLGIVLERPAVASAAACMAKCEDSNACVAYGVYSTTDEDFFFGRRKVIVETETPSAIPTDVPTAIPNHNSFCDPNGESYSGSINHSKPFCDPNRESYSDSINHNTFCDPN